MGRNKERGALRDAILLTTADDTPGRVAQFFAYERSAAQRPGFFSKALADQPICSAGNDGVMFTSAADHADTVLQFEPPAQFSASQSDARPSVGRLNVGKVSAGRW